MRIRGTIKHWNERKGFGFIRRDDGADDVFVGRRNLERQDRKSVGRKVEFDMGTDNKSGKPCALNASFIDDDAPVRFGGCNV